MKLKTVFCMMLACSIFLWSSVLSQAKTTRYEFNDQKKDRNVAFTELQCSIHLNGNADIGGTYELPKGTIAIAANGESRLQIKGECERVVIESINGQSFVDLSQLKVGKGGVLIKDINGESKLRLNSAGPIEIQSANGKSEIRFEQKVDGPKIIPGNITGEAKLIQETK